MGFCFSYKKTVREEILTNQYKINDNAAVIDALIGTLNGVRPDLADRLAAAREKIRYMNPTNNKSVIEYDEKIADNLVDLKSYIYTATQKAKWDAVEDGVDELINSLIPTRIAKSEHRTV